ncbi:unnamed protein product [Rhizophagus irregularis]|uniref:Uncharacterized protein n=1 Tax=Rhizophagus irregularis TaxID=588596 RepID=A0A2I1H303_9GLOM|nr:hypothetical protein RhiirA4_471286 [Rhizophagus irregularis]CAB4426283.1 unnamed protein product [Rhizophagus irregularis]CAB4426597.1 unnamed protein product [Rhizophagus irregularis]
MTDVKVLLNGKSITKYIRAYFDGFEGLEHNHLFNFYDIDNDEDDIKFSLTAYEQKHLGDNPFFRPGCFLKKIAAKERTNRRLAVFNAVLFSIKLDGETLRTIFEEIVRENFSEGSATNEPIISSQSHNKKLLQDWKEKKRSLEKDLEDKTRLIELQKEEINELKGKIKKMEVITKERIKLQEKKDENLEEKQRASRNSKTSKPESKLIATSGAKSPKRNH